MSIFLVSFIVWGGCLALYISCEFSNVNLKKEMSNLTYEEQVKDNISMRIRLAHDNSTTTTTRGLYFPQQLKVDTDPATIRSLTNSIADCRLYLIWLAVFSGGLLLFCLVGTFCFCAQL